MNILYLSHLNTKISQGPNYSVPAQVKAQSKYDNVFWWNLNSAKQPWWVETNVFHNTEEYSVKRIASLPAPFNRPDLVVFEGFYHGDEFIFARECRKRRIPYILVPRSALTKAGQNKKALKKKVANLLLFRRVCRKAAAIHYLTENEYKESGSGWNEEYFIIPNGSEQHERKEKFSDSGLNGVCVGRFDPYQKGLDILIDACEAKKDLLKDHNVHITLYGPERFNCKKEFENTILEKGLADILSTGEGVFGAQKHAVLKQADFFIMTSRFEGLPMSLIEAMSFGLPCFVTEGTNMADKVGMAHAGWTCQTDAESVAATFEKLVADQDKVSDYGLNAYELSKQYNWDTIGAMTHKKYNELLKISD